MDIETLKQFTPFDGLQDEYLSEALEHIKIEELKKGQMIFKRGRTVSARYYLLTGLVDLIDSQYNASSVISGTDQARTMLNADNPTRCSCVVKDPVATIFSIEA